MKDDDSDFESLNDDEEQHAIEDMADDLASITIDFCQNHDISLSEFNGLMMAQVVRMYRDQGEIDQLEMLLDHIHNTIVDIRRLNGDL
jgi:hypothetical protein